MGWEGSRSPPNTTYIRGRGGVLGDPAAEGRRRKGGVGGGGGGHSPSHRRDEEEGQTKKGPRPTHSRHHIFSPTRHHARRRQAKKSVFCVVSPRPRHAPGRLKLKAFPFATPPSTPWDSDSGVRCSPRSPQPLLLARFPTCPPLLLVDPSCLPRGPTQLFQQLFQENGGRADGALLAAEGGDEGAQGPR